MCGLDLVRKDAKTQRMCHKRAVFPCLCVHRKMQGTGCFCGLFFGNFGIFSYLCDLKEQYADSCYLKPDKFLHTRRHGWFFTSWREGKLYLCVRALSGPQIRDVAIRSRYFYV